MIIGSGIFVNFASANVNSQKIGVYNVKQQKIEAY